MYSFGDFDVVLFWFHDGNVSRRFEQSWFAWIHWNSSRHGWGWKQSSSLCKSSAVLFFIVSWSLQYLVSPIFSNVLQTSRHTLNFSAPLFRGLPCFESFTFFWHMKHNFGSKAFFRFFQNLWAWVEHYEMMMIYFIIEQVMVGAFSICWLLVLSSTTLIHLIMCMWV